MEGSQESNKRWKNAQRKQPNKRIKEEKDRRRNNKFKLSSISAGGLNSKLSSSYEQIMRGRVRRNRKRY